MTLSAWRPLKDAPHATYYTSVGDERFIAHYDLKEALGEVSCAFADVAHGDADDVCDIELGVLVPIARGEDGPEGPVLAHVAELDRAVQGEIARAFGALIQAVNDAHACAFTASDPRLALKVNFKANLLFEADRLPRIALRKFGETIHTAMGGRIPDEVP